MEKIALSDKLKERALFEFDRELLPEFKKCAPLYERIKQFFVTADYSSIVEEYDKLGLSLKAKENLLSSATISIRHFGEREFSVSLETPIIKHIDTTIASINAVASYLPKDEAYLKYLTDMRKEIQWLEPSLMREPFMLNRLRIYHAIFIQMHFIIPGQRYAFPDEPFHNKKWSPQQHIPPFESSVHTTEIECKTYHLTCRLSDGEEIHRLFFSDSDYHFYTRNWEWLK